MEPEVWESFALGQLGASAALLGLVFVGLSINLKEVISSPRLVNRAAETVVLLATLLLSATAVLVPNQSRQALGLELALMGLLLGVAVLRFQRPVPAPELAPGQPSPSPPGSNVIRRVLGLGPSILTLVAATTLLAGSGGGIYWWAAAVAVAYAGAVANAWVLLVEILR